MACNMQIWHILLLFHSLLWLALTDNGFSNIVKRRKRNLGNYAVNYPDKELAEMYWKAQVKVGVFINNDLSNNDVVANAVKRTNTPEDPAGSGSGSGTDKRNEVPRPEAHRKPGTIESEKKSQLSAKLNHIEEMSNEEHSIKDSTITCQGQKDWIQCPMYHLIKINGAFWGRDDTKTCVRSGIEHGLKTSQICAQDESNTMAKLQNACDGESACELVASPVYFDRTDCPGVYKFLRVNWECAHSESRIKESIEREKEELARHLAPVDEGSNNANKILS